MSPARFGSSPRYTSSPVYTSEPYGVFPPPIPGEKPTFQQTFRMHKSKYHDIWAGILVRTSSRHRSLAASSLTPYQQFILTFLGFVTVSAISIQGSSRYNGFSGNNIYAGTTNAVLLFALVLAIALLVSWAYFTLARLFTKQFIWLTGLLNIVVGLGTAAFYFTQGYYSAAIVFLIFSVFYIICFISWIPRIPFSVLILQTVIDVAKDYGHMFVVSFLGGLLATAFGAWFAITLISIYINYHPRSTCDAGTGGCSNAKVIGLIVFVTFAGYWISEFIRQAIHTTIAGVYGSWYFCAGKPGGMPSGATRGAYRRTMTYSFGSVSLGSLVVSLVQLLRQAVTLARQSEARQGNIVGMLCFCVLGCFVAILDWIIQFINHYAFSHIALYGKAYFPAAKDTWTYVPFLYPISPPNR